MNICVIGNDNRMDYVAEYLYSLGYEVSRNLNNMCKGTILILPPPVNNDIFYKLKDYLTLIDKIYGGSVSQSFIKMSNDINVKVYDYLTWENVISENAILTAKGIIKEGIQNSAYFENSNCIVTGYGFCGKAIASELHNIKAKVCIAARNVKIKNEVSSLGYDFIELKDLSKSDLSEFAYIFNTIPANVIDCEVIDNINSDTMVFDIASGIGGVNFEYCKKKNIKTIHSLGIPGKLYPNEAGYLIGKACHNHMNSI